MHLTWNADRAKIALNTYRTEFHIKWINFLSPDGWRPISTDLIFKANMFEMQKAPFRAEIPMSAAGQFVFESNNRYSPHQKCTINSPSLSCLVKALDIQDVHGEPMGKDAIVYPNAYQGLEADLILQAYHGRIPRLRKLVRFNKPPPGDIQLRFELELPDDVNETGQINSDLSFASKDDPLRAIHLKPARIWDSGNWRWRKKANILVTREVSGGRIILVKHIPASFFDNVVFPVYCDTDFYPVPSTTVDGDVTEFDAGGDTWSTIRGGNGTDNDDTDDDVLMFYVQCYTSSNNYYSVKRGIFLYDTSSIDVGDNITDASLSCYYYSKIDQMGWSEEESTCHVVTSNPADDDVLANGDFNSLGTISFATFLYADFGSGYEVSSAFSEAGKAAISKTGITKLGTRCGADMSDDNPSNWGSAEQCDMRCYSSEYTGTTRDSKLVVTHAPATAAMLNRVMGVI